MTRGCGQKVVRKGALEELERNAAMYLGDDDASRLGGKLQVGTQLATIAACI